MPRETPGRRMPRRPKMPQEVPANARKPQEVLGRLGRPQESSRMRPGDPRRLPGERPGRAPCFWTLFWLDPL